MMKYDARACSFNMDTGCVELTLQDGRKISIDCTGVEDALDVTMAQRSELDYLIYNDPLGYADLYKLIHFRIAVEETPARLAASRPRIRPARHSSMSQILNSGLISFRLLILTLSLFQRLCYREHITVRPTTSVRKSPRRIYRPATHPIHFAAVSPDKIHHCAAWAVFFFYGHLSGRGPSILLVQDRSVA